MAFPREHITGCFVFFWKRSRRTFGKRKDIGGKAYTHTLIMNTASREYSSIVDCMTNQVYVSVPCFLLSRAAVQ